MRKPLGKKKTQTSVIRFTGLPQPTTYYEEIRTYVRTSMYVVIICSYFFSEVVVREAIEQMYQMSVTSIMSAKPSMAATKRITLQKYNKFFKPPNFSLDFLKNNYRANADREL